MKILLDVNANVEREDIFKTIIGKENLREINHDNGVRVVKFAASKNLIFKSVIFLLRNIHKYTWIGRVLIDKSRDSNIVNA
jgi:hypothetical protein